ALLVSSALLVRTVGQMMGTTTGVNADDVVTTTVQLAQSGRQVTQQNFLQIWGETGNLHAQIVEEIRNQPAVVAVGSSNFLPPPAREAYFEAMGAEITKGRAFTAFDGPDSNGVVIVNESLAKRYLANKEPIGQTIRTWATGIGPLGLNLKTRPGRQPHEGMPFEIVGVVRDVRNVPLGQAVEPAIYFTTRQFPFAEVFLAVRAQEKS